MAAEEACAKLAFDQAARLFWLALENLPQSSPDERRVRLRLAQTLELGGRAADSARAYLDCVEGASLTEQVDYRRAAAEQLLAAGHIDEGEKILRGVLAAIGMSAPRSPLSALFWLIVYRFWIALYGLRFQGANGRLGPSRGQAPGRRALRGRLRLRHRGHHPRRVHAGAPLRRGYSQGRPLPAPSRNGHRGGPDHERGETPDEARARSRRDWPRTGGARGDRRSARLRRGDPRSGLYMRGQWREAQTRLQTPDGLVGGAMAIRHRLFLARLYFFLGDPGEGARREAEIYTEAEDRGDIYTTVSIRTTTNVRKWLAAGKPCARGAKWTRRSPSGRRPGFTFSTGRRWSTRRTSTSISATAPRPTSASCATCRS